MKFFISHSSQNKPTIKDIFSKMPLNIKTWIDEERLIWGSNLQPTFESAIKEQSDYIILFISESSSKSEWVKKEIQWAIDKEKKQHRTILLPVLIQSGEENCMQAFPEFSDKKVLILNAFDEFGIKRFAEEFSNYLFSFVCNELDEMFSPSKSNLLRTINNAENTMNSYSHSIREIVFYHRDNNPITVDELYNRLKEKLCLENDLEKGQFCYFLEQIFSKNLLPGIYFDGYELFLEEEHMAWKNELFNQRKKAVAKKAAQLIKNGMTIYLDAGSTVGETVKIICSRIKSNNLHAARFVTISIAHANAIAECCIEKGWDDSNANIQLDLIGGTLRPNTEATIPLTSEKESFNQYDKFDIAFIGANGAMPEGFSVLPHNEYARKKEAFSTAEKRVLLCDSSKCGILLPAILAGKSDNFSVIMDDAETSETYDLIKKTFADKLIIAHCEKEECV